MNLEHVLSDLARSERLPKRTIRYCLAHADALVPDFLAILSDCAHGKPLSDDAEGAVFLIVHILGELGEQRAFQPLLDLLCSGNERVDDIFGDAVAEHLAQILIATFDGDTGRVYEMIANSEIDQFIRDAIFVLWTYLVLTGEIDRDDARRYLEEFPAKVAPPDGSFLWVSWVNAIADLELEELVGAAEMAFAEERISGGELAILPLEFEDFQARMRHARTAPDREEWMRVYNYQPLHDMIGLLSKWSGFSNHHLPRAHKIDAALRSAATEINPYRSVGRNDPCPCGSGKKYKKCCLP